MTDDKGSALIFTLMVILILSVLGITILEMSLYEYKMSYAYGKNISVNYVAEAGIDITKSIIKNDLPNIQNIIEQTQKNIIDQYNNILHQDPPIGAVYMRVDYAVREHLIQVINDIIKNNNTYKLNNDSITKINNIDIKDEDNPQWPKFTIKVETVGTYKNITKYGHATLVLDLNKSNNDVLSIQSWTIDNIPPSN
jgi:type IV pilus assembly protein PilX